MCVNRVDGFAPSLDLLGEALRVGRCEDTKFGSVAESVGQVVQQRGEGLGDTDGSEDARAEERVAAETIIS
jgi:hypothetical protein